MVSAYLKLVFCDDSLFESNFSPVGLREKCRLVRGRTSGAYEATGTFQWTRAVQAISALFIKYKLSALDSKETNLLKGYQGSFASSLDYSICKQTMWLLDMFGVDSQGRPLAKRVLRVSNSNRKRPGPVALSVNANFIPHADVNIFEEEQLIESPERLSKLLKSILLEEKEVRSNPKIEELRAA